ncbi:GH92 family glycosyl hydrolase [Knoellia subterranea]|uniref:Alpha-1,2-mannosidase n=1 Tax=Knoellia subterranea KCTC 19937 TaxID=1385521 RepID=A0A0A0JSQ3_9MICO|nr:GH92 family glycosyl hydrolase [Knoellia subterranea]KGN38656.1 alpha-1,2-mannosidase [Knoellia subterranea KCTC 19937]
MRPRILTRIAAGSLGALLLAAGLGAPSNGPGMPSAAADSLLTSAVNPFIGTQDNGNTFPGASAPFGMVQVSPDTGGEGGYDYSQSFIHGFSQTHLSGVGCPVVGELPVMPTTGAVSTTDHTAYRSGFSHADEEATPGYYRVGLTKYDIDVELTATDRTGWQRYTFPAGQQANVLFNTAKANSTVFDSEVHVVGDRTIEGRIHNGNFCAGKDEHTIYFTARFDTPFESFGTWTGSTRTPGARDAATVRGGNGAWVTFPAGTTSSTLKVGLSYTGVAGARANLEAETADSFDFDATRAALTQRWEEQLGRARISGGSDARRTAYYSALYHALLHPNLAEDVDGKYFGWDGQIHTSDGWTARQNFSLWDTYRPQNQLLEILEPDVARDSYLSILAIGREGGWLPRWALANSETNIMTGDPVTPFLVEGWSKGFLAGHEAEAYALLRQNATERPPVDSQFNGRSGQHYYERLGYIPFGLELGTDCVHHGGDNDCVHPASATLEYAAADASLAIMAKALGHTADAAMFDERGRNYRNLFDAGTGTFRPRLEDGSWLDPYDPVEASHAFHEGGAYQYQWLVPQDPADLVSLLGGEEKAAQRLDDFFAYDKLLTDPERTVREDWIEATYAYYSKPTYNPNNEPDLLAPYLYAWVREPARTATVARAAYTLFNPGPDGMTGNDDLGTMSAWYVMSSWGLHPTMSGANYFVVSSPQFERTDITVGRPATGSARQGGHLAIAAPGVSDERPYIQSLSVNGARSTKSWIGWDALRSGGSIQHVVGAQPSSWGTRPADVPPTVSTSKGSSKVTLSATVRPNPLVLGTNSTSGRFNVDLVGQAQKSLPTRVTVSVPEGWSATKPSTDVVLKSNGVPASATFPVVLGLPEGVAPEDHEVVVTASAPGVPDVVRTLTVTLKEALTCASGASPCAVDLGDERNHDGTATVGASSEGNFDGSGWAYDAALLPAAGAWEHDGVEYAVPSASGTTPNFVEARGQTLLVPAGQRSRLRLVGATHNGDVTTSLRVTYTDGSTADVPVALTDWAASSGRNGNTVALDMDHRIRNGSGVDGPPVQLFAHSAATNSAKELQSITLPNDPRFEVYALTVE